MYRGTVAGVGAFVGGYLLTYLLTIAVVSAATITTYMSAVTGESGRMTAYRIVGWLHFNGHFVSSYVPELFGPESTDLVASMSSLTLLVYAVPAVTLVVAGAVTHRRLAGSSLRRTASNGLCVLLGYTPAALVAAVLVTERTARGASGPEPLAAVVFAGVIYPAVFAVGGAIAANELFG